MQRGLRMGLTPSDSTARHSHTMSRQTCLLAPLQPAKRNSVVRPSGRCCTFQEREKKPLGRPSAPTSDASHAEAQRLADKVFTLPRKGPCTVLLFSIQVFASRDLAINHTLNIPSLSSGWNWVEKILEGLFSVAKKMSQPG